MVPREGNVFLLEKVIVPVQHLCSEASFRFQSNGPYLDRGMYFFYFGKSACCFIRPLTAGWQGVNFLPFFAFVEESFPISRVTPSRWDDVCPTEML